MNLALIVLLPFIGALFPAFLIRAGRNACAYGTGAFTLVAFVLLLVQAPAVFSGQVIQARFEWLPQLGLNVNFFLDGLGFLFALLILGIGLLIILYARFYLSHKDPMGRFYVYLMLFQGAMVGIVLSDNILLLLIFWELTSLSSFLLIGYWRHLPEARQGARMALAVTGGGGLALIGGMILLGQIAGSYDLSEILQAGDQIRSSSLYLPALLLILTGAFAKSAQFPLHFWLPHAMAAPTPVSAYLHSATMVKAGVFLLARIWPALSGTPEWFYIVTSFGLVTMIVSAWIAIFKDDLKGLLAFSTVSHLGLITMLFGFGTPLAAMAGVFHIINHATFKAALFMSAGIVDHEAHTRDMRRLGGLLTLMPITATLALVAAASMAGIPLLNGFISKEMMLEEAVHTSYLGQDWVLPVFATLGALFSVAYAARFAFHTFLGPVRNDYPHKPHDPPFGMWLPVSILVSLVVLIGLLPGLIAEPLVKVTTGAVTGGNTPDYHLAIWHGFTPALFMSMIALAGGLTLMALYFPAKSFRESFPRPEAKVIFEAIIEAIANVSRQITELAHNGSLQRYLAVMVSAIIAVGFAGYLGSTPLAAGERSMVPINWPGLVAWVLLVMSLGATLMFHHNRLFALILIGVVGMVVSLTFFYFSAPDLALTQISVEVVTVVLMLLALNFLPKETPRESSSLRKLRDLVLSGLAGLGVAGLVYAVTTRGFESISDYHLAESKPGGGGTNVVNVILVDFRGFDTFGEIIVLGIAALAIYALLDSALHGAAQRRLSKWVPEGMRAMDPHPFILVIATRVLLPLALMVGVYIFLRGHNQPGGGFIAGLVVSIALLMQYMASGFSWAQHKLKLDYHGLIGAGVLAAGLTGVGAWFAGRPFLTSDYTYVHLPVIGEFELATALGFDVGVFLTVVGAVMVALANLSRIGKRADAAYEAQEQTTDGKEA
ncbi:monovalent cation/H+ antiporter subunit A [Fodinicurvata sediminis]|uniref:monovalent cation/H+ antiporter subunit A n=1 Tax=Fodinicurvata sediminis TaxID=1121832 RepID=UPI0003B5F6B2|nr:monovalent cation/H+ antiporter subunit A [Fodinicurvata sediminis]